MPVKKPLQCRELSYEEMMEDGGKVEWWGWMMIGIAALSLGVGIYWACTRSSPSIAPTQEKLSEMADEGYAHFCRVDDLKAAMKSSDKYDAARAKMHLTIYATQGCLVKVDGSWYVKPF